MKSIVKFLVSFGLLGFVLYKVDVTNLFALLKEADIFMLVWAFLFFNLSKIVSAVRLDYYFKEIAISLSFKKNLILYYIGMFYNLFLPGGIGGDGYKAYLLNKHFDTRLTLILQSLLFDRISGLVSLVFLASILFLLSDYAISPFNIMAYSVALSIYAIFYLISKKLNKFMYYFKQTTVLGFLVQVLQLVSAFFIIKSLPESVPVINFLVLFLISSVVSILPVTVGGVGVRELTFLYGLHFIGYAADAGIAFSFLFFFITFLSSLIGIYFTTFFKIELAE